MDRLRKTIIYSIVNDFPLTTEESRLAPNLYSNPTWLPEHRAKPWTHPHAKDVLVASRYHLYANTGDPFHWSNLEPMLGIMFHGYNPTLKIMENCVLFHACNMRPIFQRYLSFLSSNIIDEMFDVLDPTYWKIE